MPTPLWSGEMQPCGVLSKHWTALMLLAAVRTPPVSDLVRPADAWLLSARA